VHAQEPAVHLHLLRVLERLPEHPRPDGAPRSTAAPAPWRIRGFARSRGGWRERGLTRRSGESHASRCHSTKNRDGILPHFTPSPHPRLLLHRPPSSSATKSTKNLLLKDSGSINAGDSFVSCAGSS
jgi:hypothetical protein